MRENPGNPAIISMSLIPYSLTRPILFGMDPEAAHDLTMNLMAKGQNTLLQKAWERPLISDPIEPGGPQVPEPRRHGSRPGQECTLHRCAGRHGFRLCGSGHRHAPSPARQPQARMFRIPEKNALINRLGFNNEGLDAFLANVRRSQVRAKAGNNGGAMLLGLNIGKNATTPIEEATSDYIKALDGVYPHADYVTVNISSPTPRICVRCRATRRWMRCWVRSPIAANSFPASMASARRCS